MSDNTKKVHQLDNVDHSKSLEILLSMQILFNINTTSRLSSYCMSSIVCLFVVCYIKVTIRPSMSKLGVVEELKNDMTWGSKNKIMQGKVVNTDAS